MKAKLLIAVILGCSLSASAGLIYSHSGAADPVSEGWLIGGSGSIGIITGPIYDDGGSGVDAWQVSDTSSVGGANQSYYREVSDVDIANGNTYGWSFLTTMRVPDASTVAGSSPMILYRDGSKSWDLYFGSEDDGDLFVLLADGTGSFPSYGGTTYVLEGSGATYHNFELVYDAVDGLADLFVDGIERISDYTGISGTSSKTMGWGAGSSVDTGKGNYNSVEFHVIPEPATISLVILAGVGAFIRKRLMTEKGSRSSDLSNMP